MATTIATFHARNDDGQTTKIDVVGLFDGTYCADSADLGMGHRFKNNDAKKIAAELARRHGYSLFTPEKTPTTFAEFIESRKAVEDLADYYPDQFTECEPIPGFVYLDSFYIYTVVRESVDREGNPQFDDDHVVTIGCGEYTFGDDLDAAEKFLWDEFAMLETNPQLRACQFTWDFGDDEEPTDGFTDGSVWNGWDNVCVTEKVHKQICEDFDAYLPAKDREELKGLLAQPQSEERDDAIYCINSFHLVEQDEFRLYDYGNCYTPTICEDHYHTVNR